MKNSKITALLAISFAINSISSINLASDGVSEEKRQKVSIKDRINGILTVTGVAGAMAAGYKAGISPYALMAVPYIGMQFAGDNIDRPTLSNDHIYAQRWYDSLATKYPQAHFDQYKLTEDTDPDSEFAAIGSCIQINSKILSKINNAFFKQVQQERLSPEEQWLLANAEWSILHESAHLKYHDVSHRAYMRIGVLAGIEGLYQLARYKYITPSMCNKNMLTKTGVGVGLCLGMLWLNECLNNFYYRFTERRADDFANKLADKEALIAAMDDWNKKKETNGEIPIVSTHPSHQSRIDAIQKELENRIA